MPLFEELRVFSGNAHPELAQAICEYLGISPGQARAYKFSNDNTFVQFQENIRQRDVFLVEPFASSKDTSPRWILITLPFTATDA